MSITVYVCVQVLSQIQLFVTPWTAEHQASQTFIISQSSLKFMSIESVMVSKIISSSATSPLLLPSIFPASGLFPWVGCSHQVAKVLKLQLQHQYFQWIFRIDFHSVQFSRSAMTDFLWPQGLQHARSPCSTSTPRVYPNSYQESVTSLSQWCHPTISSSVVPFSRLQSFPASTYFPMS